MHKIQEYAQKGTQVDLAKACAVDAVLHDALKHARQMNPRREYELFSEETRLAFGDVRLMLGQKVRQCEEECRRERRQEHREYLLAVTLMRSRAQEITRELNSRYWHGLGYGWDADS